MAVHRGGRVLYPGFQLDRGTGSIRSVIAELLHAAESAGLSERALTRWLLGHSEPRESTRPVDLLDDPDRILEAGRRWSTRGQSAPDS